MVQCSLSDTYVGILAPQFAAACLLKIWQSKSRCLYVSEKEHDAKEKRERKH